MSDKATAERLFQELGPLFDPAAIVYDAAEGLWSVVVDGTTRIDAAYDREADQFVFALDLGEVPDQSAEAVHEMLLRFSFLWRETGGLHASLDADGRAVLMYKQTVQGLEVQRLQILLQNLATHRQLWADLIAKTEEEGFDPEKFEPPVPVGGIRV